MLNFHVEHRILAAVFCMWLTAIMPVFAGAEPTGTTNKIGVHLQSLLHTHNKNERSDELNSQRYISVLLQGESQSIVRLVQESGGTVGTIAGDILTARIPIHETLNLVSQTAVRRMEIGAPLQTFNLEARKHVGADKAHQGVSPLMRGYTGEDVILGIIDTGIDFRHPEFREALDSNSSRILYLWDQNAGDGPPLQEFDYGAEWTQADIENELDGTVTEYVTHEDWHGHGTHVAATAAGSITGMAPDSEIIMVSFWNPGPFGESSPSFFNNQERLSAHFIDATAYIIEKARALAKPVVINASLGTSLGPRNGKDLASIALDRVLASYPYAILCAAAGNDGDSYMHWGGANLSSDSLWTYFYSAFGGKPSAYIALDEQYLTTLSFAIGIDSTNYANDTSNILRDMTPLEQSAWFSAQDLVNQGQTELRFTNESGVELASCILTVAHNPEGFVEVLLEARHVVEQKLKSREGNTTTYFYSPATYFRLLVKGAGEFHTWFRPGIDITIPAPAERNIIVNESFKAPDNNYSTTAFPSCALNVISVGSYTSSPHFINVDGDTIRAAREPGPAGRLSWFSSRGPSVDGRIKPDITAPGENVNSAHSAFSSENRALKPHGQPGYVVFSGTSMATPVVAGSLALLMEQHPELTVEEARVHMRNTARTDEFTASAGMLPNNRWGYGKLDIFTMLSSEISTSVYPAQPEANRTLQAWPNPFSHKLWLTYQLPESAFAKLSLYNSLGRELTTIMEDFQEQGEHKIAWNANELPEGVYFAVLQYENWREVYKLTLLR